MMANIVLHEWAKMQRGIVLHVAVADEEVASSCDNEHQNCEAQKFSV